MLVGVLVVSGAVWAVLHGDNEDDGEAEGRTPPPDLPDATSTEHLFPADYVGPVWITVEAADATPRDVTIRWGTWERIIVHQSAEPLVYEFTKERAETAETNVPAVVEVDPGADVAFDQGTEAPEDAVDVNEGWLEIVPEGSTSSAPTATTTTVPG
jgi:hypothetical protein